MPTRPGPPELHVVKSPDRLARTSGRVVIVEVRPAGESARSSCSAQGLPSPELDPAQLRREPLSSSDAVASFEERTEKRGAPFQVAIVPVSPLVHQRCYAPPYFTPVFLMPPFSDTPLPHLRLRHSSLPHHTTNLTHTIGIRGLIVVDDRSVGCGTTGVPAVGTHCAFNPQDDAGVGVSVPDGVGGSRRRDPPSVDDSGRLLQRVRYTTGCVPRRRPGRTRRGSRHRNRLGGQRGTSVQPPRDVCRSDLGPAAGASSDALTAFFAGTGCRTNGCP